MVAARSLLGWGLAGAVASAVLVLCPGPPASADGGWDWAGEWEVIEGVDYEPQYLSLERLDTDLAGFEARLPDWAWALRGACLPNGGFYHGSTSDLGFPGESGDIYACEFDHSVGVRFADSVEGVFTPWPESMVYDLWGAIGYGTTPGSPDVEPPFGYWAYNMFGMRLADDGTVAADTLQPTNYGENSAWQGAWYTDVPLYDVACTAGACLGTPKEPATASTESGGGFPTIWVLGPLAVAAGAAGAAAAARGARKRRRSAQPQQEEQKQLVVQVSPEELTVTTSRKATLQVAAWEVSPTGAVTAAPIPLEILAPPESGLIADPSTGTSRLDSEIRLDAVATEDLVWIWVRAHGEGGLEQRPVAVHLSVDYEFEVF